MRTDMEARTARAIFERRLIFTSAKPHPLTAGERLLKLLLTYLRPVIHETRINSSASADTIAWYMCESATRVQRETTVDSPKMMIYERRCANSRSLRVGCSARIQRVCPLSSCPIEKYQSSRCTGTLSFLTRCTLMRPQSTRSRLNDRRDKSRRYLSPHTGSFKSLLSGH